MRVQFSSKQKLNSNQNQTKRYFTLANASSVQLIKLNPLKSSAARDCAIIKMTNLRMSDGKSNQFALKIDASTDRTRSVAKVP